MNTDERVAEIRERVAIAQKRYADGGLIGSLARAFVNEDMPILLAALEEARAERDRYKAALVDIAAYDDEMASHTLETHGSYGSFDEPGSVRIARLALHPEHREDGK